MAKKFIAYYGSEFTIEWYFNNRGKSISLPNRFLCFFYDGSRIVITNAFEKKSQKMPLKEKEKALKIEKDYIKRYKQGVYYD